jgi:putative nucleotidyltransferase with HDIG domain
MTIPKDYQNRCVYHFTHVDNLPGILEHGLLSTNEKNRLGIKHTAIAYTDIQSRRSCMKVPCGPGGVVHDYVPLYFCKRSSMLLAVINGKIADQQLIIYFEFPISVMNQYPWVLTDASANTSMPPNFYDNDENLCKLKWEHIDSKKWGKFSEKEKQARQAELLIHKQIPITAVSKIIVWNESIRDYILKEYENAKMAKPHIGFDGHHYYTDFLDSRKKSIVTGPYFIKQAYKDNIEDLIPNIGKASEPQFNKLSSLLEKGLRKNLDCLPETAELIGLESDNSTHVEDVGKHTLRVVKKLLELHEYESLNKIDKLLAEVSAYLHDIGKGPKSRWIENKGKQKVDPDHPIKALPMLKRILTEEIETLTKRSAKVICKLVCYHDLIGDIIGKGRRIEELIDVVEDERELNMLIALGKSDMLAINPAWANDEIIDDIRTQVKDALASKAVEE